MFMRILQFYNLMGIPAEADHRSGRMPTGNPI
jgi:hypothetical protein